MKTYRVVYEDGDERGHESITTSDMLRALQIFGDIHPGVEPITCGVEVKMLTKREKAQAADEARRREKTAHGMEKMKDELRSRRDEHRARTGQKDLGITEGAEGGEEVPPGGR